MLSGLRWKCVLGLTLCAFASEGAPADSDEDSAPVDSSAVSDDGLWRIAAGSPVESSQDPPRLTASLDRSGFEEVLSRLSKDQGTPDAPDSRDPIVTLPLPDGSFVPILVAPSPSETQPSSAVLAMQGQNPSGEISARIEWTEDGLYAVVTGLAETVYIDPNVAGGRDSHVSYYASDAGRPLVVGADLPLKAVRDIEAVMAAKSQRTPVQRKIGSRLLDAATKGSPESLDADSLGRVLVDITADVSPALLGLIAEFGGAVTDSVERHDAIRARLPLDAIEPLAGESAVRRIEPADRAATNGESDTAAQDDDRGLSRVGTLAPLRVVELAGSEVAVPSAVQGDMPQSASAGEKENTSEGDIAHDALSARSDFGVDGTGIGIGVLSNGVRTLAHRQASGDIPEVTVLPGQDGREGDEGTAMLEIIHDLAPGAHLYFATGLGGQARFVANIEALCAAGADVIVDDLFYFSEGAFQDDTIAKAINNVVESGCFYVTPAGNSGNLDHGTAGVWEGDFATAEDAPEGIEGTAHDFGDGSANRIDTLGLGFLLKWADPLGASSNDYDLYLFDETLTTILDSSTDDQTGSDDPYEFIPTWNTEPGSHLVVVKASGEDRFIRLNTLRGTLGNATDGQIFGHFGARNAITTAAVNALSAGGSGGVFDGTESVEDFSSDGPRRIFFEPDGSPIKPNDFSATGGELVAKPDIAAADGVSTATPNFAEFFGTSAAAPHAAAIVALALEAAGGPRRVTLASLRSALADAALDIEAEGTDRNSGAGIPMAPAVVAALQSTASHKAPTVATAIDDQVLLAGNHLTLDLNDHFHDDDDLTFSVQTSDSRIVSIDTSGSVITLTPGVRGSSTIVLRATDPGGLSAVMTFVVTVDRMWGQTDYDRDDDGLIEIANLDQLDAIRHDLDGDGSEDEPSAAAPYFAAFSDAARNMGCPDRCAGYELIADLDFDVASSYASGRVDRGWSTGEGGSGWNPIGAVRGDFVSRGIRFAARFDGNGHTIANLFIERPEQDGVGLFGLVGGTGGQDAYLRNLRLMDVAVSGREYVGGLVGAHWDTVATWEGSMPVSGIGVTGRVVGNGTVGGLAGFGAQITRSFAAVEVSGTYTVGGLVGTSGSTIATISASYATGSVSGEYEAGGLVGLNLGDIVACYATGTTTGKDRVGGLAATNTDTIRAAYATGRVIGERRTGGLIGESQARSVLRANYWNIETSGSTVGVGSDDANADGVIDGDETRTVGATGMNTVDLTAPHAYRGIYANWNVAVDRDPDNLSYFYYEGNNPWHFGNAREYPVLNADFDDPDGVPTWQEFGRQLRAQLDLSLTASNGVVVLDWSTPDTEHWKTTPAVDFVVYRNGQVLSQNVQSTTFEDVPPADGTTTYDYQVAATIDNGEPVRSQIAVVRNRPPTPPGLAAQATRVGNSYDYTFRPSHDPDGHSISYRVATTPRWLTFDPSTRTFSGSPEAGDAGTTAIRVTATDSGTPPLAATAVFDLTVNPSGGDNEAPEVEATIDDLAMETGDVETIALDAVFRDPDDDALTYTTTVADPSVATAYPDGESLTVEATATGRSTVTVTASDGTLTAETQFDVGVANAPPRALGLIPERALSLPGQSVTFDVAANFVDPDGDALTYAADSTAPHIVTVALDHSDLTLVPRAGGTATVTVTATDEAGSNSTVGQTASVRVRVDYDTDGDGLIEVADLDQLDALRHDLDGDAVIGGGTGRYPPSPDSGSIYAAAFPEPAHNMGCPAGCRGYELTADLDFDTNGSGGPDPEDDYWNGGAGWDPLGVPGSRFGIALILYREQTFGGTFDGNDHVVSGLFIDRGDEAAVGLFGIVWTDGALTNLRLVDVDVTGDVLVGSAVGLSRGTVSGVLATGVVDGNFEVGGLAGASRRLIDASRASTTVRGEQVVGGLVGTNSGTVARSFATGTSMVEDGATDATDVGGLVGLNFRGVVAASYATGTTIGPATRTGGLIGNNYEGEVVASYTTGSVHEGGGTVGSYGGLVGENTGTITTSYAERHYPGASSVGKPNSRIGSRTTADLLQANSYSGIYSNWNLDLDDDGKEDDPWDFALDVYPALKLDLDDDGTATRLAFGPQRGPTGVIVRSSRMDDDIVEVTWDPPADTAEADIVAYEVQRKVGDGPFSSVDPPHASVTSSYSDAGIVDGIAYTYRVRAKTMEGDSSWSPPASTAPGPPLLAVEAGDARATLTWTPPTDSGTSDLVGYQYQQTTDGGATWSPAWTDIPDADGTREFTVENLPNGTAHGFELRAKNQSGPGAGSARVTVTTGHLPPGPPRSLSAVAGHDQVALQWSAPADTGSSTIIRYELRQSVDDGDSWMPDWTAVPGGTSVSHVLQGLEGATSYTFEIRAVNAFGPGTPARTSIRTPPGDIPEVGLVILGDPENLHLEGFFSVSPGGSLTYSATSDDPTLVTVQVADGLLVVTPNTDGDEGSTTITVIATDAIGGSITRTFVVTVDPAPGFWRRLSFAVLAEVSREADGEAEENE